MYLRAHPSLQGDMEQWASALSALGERSQPALRFLLGFLTGDSRITQTVSASLFGCQEDCLCLADDCEYLVVGHLCGTEFVSSIPCTAPRLSIIALPLLRTDAEAQSRNLVMQPISSSSSCRRVGAAHHSHQF